METSPASKSKRRVKPRRESWTTLRRFRCPEKNERFLITWRLDQAVNNHRGDGRFAFGCDERIYLPEEVFNALVIKLEQVDLPFDRYLLWCEHGTQSCDTEISSTLSPVRLA